MKKKIKTMLKKFDIFGVEPNFHYKSKKNYQSSAGGIIFFLCFLMIIIYFYINLKSILNRKKILKIFLFHLHLDLNVQNLTKFFLKKIKKNYLI
jgi:phosphomannomutase